MTREDKIQEILNYIRFDLPGIKEEISKNIDLFEEDNGEHPFEEKEFWNEDYIAKNIVWLRKNFSKKRLEHLIEVRNYLRGEIKKSKKESPQKIKEISQSSNIQKSKTVFEKVKNGSKMLYKFIFSDPKKKSKINKEKEKYDRKF